MDEVVLGVVVVVDDMWFTSMECGVTWCLGEMWLWLVWVKKK